MQYLNIVIVLSFLHYAHVRACDKGSCHDIGNQQVCYDPSCAQGGLGCNAGGQGQECRFCGFDQFSACPGGSNDQNWQLFCKKN